MSPDSGNTPANLSIYLPSDYRTAPIRSFMSSTPYLLM